MWTDGQPRTVLHVLFSAGLGGCESLCVDLVRHLDGSRWRSEVVFLLAQPGPMHERLKALGIPVHTCQFDRAHRLQFICRFAKLCRERRATAAITHSFGVHPFVAMGAKLGGVRRFLVMVGNPPPSDASTRRKTALLAHLGRPFVDREVACSHYVAGRIAREYHLPEKRIIVLANWCDAEDICRRAAAVRLRRKAGGPVVGIVARLDPIKDHPTVLRAFARFSGSCRDARLRVIGDGPKRGILERMAGELGIGRATEFTGARTDVPEQLGDLDVFAYATTAQEGFGIVMAEAMAAGVPVVASDIGPCAEVLDGGRAGLLARRGDPEDLARQLFRVWQSTEVRADLIRQAHQLVRDRYSARGAARRFEELLDG